MAGAAIALSVFVHPSILGRVFMSLWAVSFRRCFFRRAKRLLALMPRADGRIGADAALSVPVPANDGVCRGILMALGAVRLSRVFRCKARAAQHVFASGHRFKVVRVGARAIAVQVIQRQAFRNRAHEALLRPALNYQVMPADVKLTVAVL